MNVIFFFNINYFVCCFIYNLNIYFCYRSQQILYTIILLLRTISVSVYLLYYFFILNLERERERDKKIFKNYTYKIRKKNQKIKISLSRLCEYIKLFRDLEIYYYRYFRLTILYYFHVYKMMHRTRLV